MACRLWKICDGHSGSHKRCGRPFVGYLPWTWILVPCRGETPVNLCKLRKFAEDWNQSQGPEHEIRRYDRIVQVTWMSNLDSQEILQPNQLMASRSFCQDFWFNSCLHLELDATDCRLNLTQSIHGTPFATFFLWGGLGVSQCQPVKIEVNGKKISGLDVDLHIEDLHILDVFCTFRKLFCFVEMSPIWEFGRWSNLLIDFSIFFYRKNVNASNVPCSLRLQIRRTKAKPTFSSRFSVLWSAR